VSALGSMQKHAGIAQKSTVLIDPANVGATLGTSGHGTVRMAPSGATTKAAGYGL